jgi:hypothetical protein
MNAYDINHDTWRVLLLAELTAAAQLVASRHGVTGSSADQSLDLWKALSSVVREQDGRHAGKAGWTNDRASREALIEGATTAAYQVALRRGFQGSFLDLELDLWRHLCRAVRRNGSAPQPDRFA